MRTVEQRQPIDRTDDDRFAGAEQDEADTLERVADTRHRGNPTATNRMPKRRCHVEAERRKLEFSLSQCALPGPDTRR